MQKRLITGLIASAMLLLAIGCSDNGTTTDESIADEFGGYEPTAESVAFGNPEIASTMTDDEDYNDPMLTEAVVDSQLQCTESNIYALRIVWGMLECDTSMTTPTDWSGSLTISRGSEVLRKVIKFEPATDWIVIRDDRAVIEWVSETTIHHDGVMVNLVIPPEDSATATGDPVTVTFDTEPFQMTFDVTDLAALDTVYYLDDSNAVAFYGFKVDRVPCPKGFLAGNWGKDEEGNGIFYGKWMSHYGGLEGHLEGTWGIDNDGEEANVFYGKYIDSDGNFMGLLKGRYHVSNSHSAHRRLNGWFRGYYYDGDGNILGVLKGNYHEKVDNSSYGTFQGRWREYCNASLADTIDDGLDE